MRLIYITKKNQTVLGVILVVGIFLGFLGLRGKTDKEHLDAYITLAVMIVSAFLFITEIFSLVITSMGIPIILVLTGVITPDRAFQGFANDNVVLFASMFIVGGALFKTGVAERIGKMVVSLTRGSERRLLIGIAAMVCFFSAFLSNTGTVAVLLPVCLGIVDAVGWDRKNILMVLAMTASTGGMITLVGTPPNITVNAVLTQNGLQPFGFFEYAYIGIPLSIAGSAYLVLTRKLSGAPPKATGQGAEEKEQPLERKQWIAILVMVGVVMAMAFNLLSLHIASALGALVCVGFGLLTEEDAIESIDWTTIFLFAGTLVLAEALDKTGAGRMIADVVIGIVGSDANETVLLTALFVLAVSLTQFMSNTASCALLAPIGLQIAAGLNADPRAAMIIVAVAASSAFATPMATPPNTLVMGPGRFTMKDYLRTGLPLILIAYIISILIVPRVWPLYG